MTECMEEHIEHQNTHDEKKASKGVKRVRGEESGTARRPRRNSLHQREVDIARTCELVVMSIA